MIRFSSPGSGFSLVEDDSEPYANIALGGSFGAYFEVAIAARTRKS